MTTMPTVGRIVHVNLPDYQPPVAAIVTAVCPDDDSLIEAHLYLPHGVAEPPFPWRFPYAPEPTEGHWTWPNHTPTKEHAR